MIVTGTAVTIGDSVDTDMMLPGAALRMPDEAAAGMLFHGYDSTLVGRLPRPSIIIAGERFGLGSARPVARYLVRAGVAAVVARSMSSLFQRNCVNTGLPAAELTAPLAVTDGDAVSIDFRTGEVTVGEEAVGQVRPLPALLLEIVVHGGVLKMLEEAGYFDDGPDGDRSIGVAVRAASVHT